jgi:hypothetical protein
MHTDEHGLVGTKMFDTNFTNGREFNSEGNLTTEQPVGKNQFAIIRAIRVNPFSQLYRYG